MTDVALEPQTVAPVDTAWNRVAADLIEMPAEGEGGEFRPTPYAARYLWQLLTAAGPQMGAAFPYGYVSVDGAGGVRIEWRQDAREMSLQIFDTAAKKHYVYPEEGDDYGSEDVTDAGVLTRWLNWINGASL